MLDGATIRNISDVAAYRASEEGLVPLTPWKIEDLRHIPFLGSYCPPGYRPATYGEFPDVRRGYGDGDDDPIDFFVDGSGFGSDAEPALTFDRFAELAVDLGQYFAIIEEGQFQVYVRMYVQDPDAEGTEAPSEASLACEDCGEVHGPFEECEEQLCRGCGEFVEESGGSLCDICAEVSI